MASDTLPNDLYEVIRGRAEEILRADPLEVDFVCRDAATELAAVVMSHFQEVFSRHVEDLRRRDEKLTYEKSARVRAEGRSVRAREIIEAAGNTPPHEWASWEKSAQEWLGG